MIIQGVGDLSSVQLKLLISVNDWGKLFHSFIAEGKKECRYVSVLTGGI